MDLKELRDQIDMIDNDLVSLFIKRMEISAQVAVYKKENNLPVYIPAREQEILQDIAKKAGPEFADYACELYSIIFQLSRNYQVKQYSSD